MRPAATSPEPAEAELGARPAPGPVVVRAEGLSKGYPRIAARAHMRLFSRFGGIAESTDDDEEDEVDDEDARLAEDAAARWVVRNVDLELRGGTATAIAGPQNSGKTSLVEALAGLAPPTEGRVWAAGRVVPVQDNLPKLMQDGPAWRNVVLLARIMGLPRRWARARLDSVFELAGLSGSEGRQRRSMPTPEVQRLGIATMLHVDGVAYLVDSTLGTEPAFRERCLSLLTEKKASGAAIVHTFRDLEGAERLCDSAVWLERGAVVARGTSSEVAAAVGETRARSGGADLPSPTPDAVRLFEFLEVALGEVRAADALHVATAAAYEAGEAEVGWAGLAAEAGYDVSEAQRIVDRLARRKTRGDRHGG